MGYGLQNAYGCAQLEVGAVHHFLVACEGHHPSSRLYVVGTQLCQLFRQHVLQSHEGLGYEFKLFVSHFLLIFLFHD